MSKRKVTLLKLLRLLKGSHVVQHYVSGGLWCIL